MTEQINIDELERLAKAATPGPWSQAGCRVTAKELGYDRVADTEFDNESMAENAAFIAAANPTTVLALISQLRAVGDRAMHLERRLSDANGEVLRLQGADQHALQLQAGHDEAVMRAQALEQERDALAAQIKELDARIDDLLATCHRLALELECLLLDTKDLAPVSRWWDAAMAALDGWHKAKDAASVRLAPAERPTPATRPGWRDINDIVADREKDPSKAAALERAREWLAAAQPIIPADPVNARLLERISEAVSAYERFGGICTFEGEPMIHASTFLEIAEIAAESQQVEPVRLLDLVKRFQDYLHGPTAWSQDQEDELSQEISAVLRANGYKVEG